MQCLNFEFEQDFESGLMLETESFLSLPTENGFQNYNPGDCFYLKLLLNVLYIDLSTRAGQAFTKHLELRSWSNSKFQHWISDSIWLPLLLYCGCLWNIPCFTGRQNIRALAVKLRSVFKIEILSLSKISTWGPLWKPCLTLMNIMNI